MTDLQTLLNRPTEIAYDSEILARNIYILPAGGTAAAFPELEPAVPTACFNGRGQGLKFLGPNEDCDRAVTVSDYFHMHPESLLAGLQQQGTVRGVRSVDIGGFDDNGPFTDYHGFFPFDLSLQTDENCIHGNLTLSDRCITASRSSLRLGNDASVFNNAGRFMGSDAKDKAREFIHEIAEGYVRLYLDADIDVHTTSDGLAITKGDLQLVHTRRIAECYVQLVFHTPEAQTQALLAEFQRMWKHKQHL